MSGEERFFCSVQALRRGDQLAGTASPGRVWILIEYRGVWPFSGFAGLDIDPRIKAAVTQAARQAQARIFLIRKSGRRRSQPDAQWAILRFSADGAYQQSWGVWRHQTDLLEICGALERPGQTGLPPVYLVCTHGRHDVCCARWGRPVAAYLAERWPEQTWESSHVGGDRFAANLVVLPDGIYFGEVSGEQAVNMLEEVSRNRISASHLRGYTNLGAPQQVAVAAALTEFGPAGRLAWQVKSAERVKDDWFIQLSGSTGLPAQVNVHLRGYLSEPNRLTCRAVIPTRSVEFKIVSITSE